MRFCWLNILSKLPLCVHHFFADYLIYPLMYYIVRYRMRLVDKNLRNSFPDWSDAQRKILRKRFYHQFADVMVETIWGYKATDAEMREHLIFENSEAFNAAIREHKGAMAMLAHLGTWEWIADYGRRVEPDGMYELNVYRRLRNKYFDRLMLEIRSKRGGGCVEKNVLLRHMVQMRSEGRLPIYGMLCDQKPSMRNAHVWTTFLNQETSILNGAEVLSRRFDYPCFYLHICSPKRGYYTVTFVAMQSDNITEEYARLLEQNILEQPHLWLWTHNRWKHKRPQQEASTVMPSAKIG